MDDGWSNFADTFEAKEHDAPLTMADIPQIRVQASAILRHVTQDSTGFRASCPFHVSTDGTSVTLRVNLDPTSPLGIGFFKCYRCNERGHWNKLARHVGLDPITGDANPEVKHLLTPIRISRTMYRAPAGLNDWPAGAPWRRRNKDGSTTTISAYAFNILGAKWMDYDYAIEEPTVVDGRSYYPGDFIREKRAWLPVIDNNNEPIAHVLALLSKRWDGCKKYLNDSGPWAKKHIAFFQQVQQIQSDRLVLVEGPADALRLIDYNIPAVPLLGVSTWTPLKSQMVASMYDMAIVCLDGDGAGQPAQAAVAASLQGVVNKLHTIQMPHKQDPASIQDPLFSQFINAILAKR